MKKSYFIMLMALAFLLQGCRSGDLAEMQDNPTETQHSSKNYASLDKFLQVTGIRKDDLYKDLSFSKETSSDEEFEVNTNKILETIKNQQVTAFSFIVYPKNGSTVEQQNNKDVFYNMAYLKKGNHWEKYILKYTVEKGWLSSLDTQPNKPFNGSITMIYPNAAASKTYVCGFSAVPVFYCWAGHTDPNDDDCGNCWHWNTTSILCDDGSTANPNPDDGTATGGASGFETNLPTEEYEAMMVQKFASFINNFNLTSYGFSTELKTKLFHLYLSLQEDDYIISQLLSASPTNSPQKANLLNWAIDYFNENLSTTPVDELTTSTKNFLTWGSNFFIQNPTTSWEQFQNWFLEEPVSGSLQNELFEDWADPTRVKPTTRFKKHIKINSIYNKIKAAANFKQYLQNFEPTFSVAHLMFDIGPNQISNAIAETTEPQNYWIKITFNKDKDFANMPKVLIAYTFMHEMIHAEMLRKLLSISSTPQGNIDWNLVKSYNTSHNYPGLFDYYIRFMNGNTNYQHEAMGAHYVNIMVNFLKQVYGTHYTNTEYETIVWMGLQGTTAWNLLPQSKKDLYTNTWNTNYWLWEI
ncbi:hypothetical protein [uncultured Chryseobacterium sp.]|uniref:hypothetical protein n=1 Tax=uncultured Chryseobacterium sp. TaxID=259322 RepID=UPI00374A08CA